MNHWLLLAALVITPNDVKTAECRVACEYSGYDTGYYVKDLCGCVDFKDYENATHEKRIILPHRHEIKKPNTQGKREIYQYPPDPPLPKDAPEPEPNIPFDFSILFSS
jgi:hypothetical protein